jgi:hypothetical protein
MKPRQGRVQGLLKLRVGSVCTARSFAGQLAVAERRMEERAEPAGGGQTGGSACGVSTTRSGFGRARTPSSPPVDPHTVLNQPAGSYTEFPSTTQQLIYCHQPSRRNILLISNQLFLSGAQVPQHIHQFK